MFVLGVRTSTLLAVAAFVVLAAVRHHRRPLLAGAAWLFGFEAVFQIAQLSWGRPLPAMKWGPFLLIGLGVAAVYAAERNGVRPAIVPLMLGGLVFLAWLVTGFHINNQPITDPTAETLNETAKTLWAIAFLLPVLERRKPPHPQGAGRRRAETQGRAGFQPH